MMDNFQIVLSHQAAAITVCQGPLQGLSQAADVADRKNASLR
jgi:hypothetical protein